jgi:hypothetical protein
VRSTTTKPSATVTPLRKVRHVNRDRGYRFDGRTDPAMIELCQLITDSGKNVATICLAVRSDSKGVCNISPTTVSNWLSGKTRRPQNWTMNWVGFSLGFERKWARR